MFLPVGPSPESTVVIPYRVCVVNQCVLEASVEFSQYASVADLWSYVWKQVRARVCQGQS